MDRVLDIDRRCRACPVKELPAWVAFVGFFAFRQISGDVKNIFARTVTKKPLCYTLVQNRANICLLILVDATESKTVTITKHRQRVKKGI
jgi:hypothetical protein